MVGTGRGVLHVRLRQHSLLAEAQCTTHFSSPLGAGDPRFGDPFPVLACPSNPPSLSYLYPSLVPPFGLRPLSLPHVCAAAFSVGLYLRVLNTTALLPFLSQQTLKGEMTGSLPFVQ